MKLSRKVMLVGAVSALVGLVAPAAHAEDPTDVTVTAGSLAITSPTVANFTAVTLNGAAQTTTAAMDAFSVSDLRGIGAGWNTTVQASQFAEHDGSAYVTDGKTLAQNSLSMPELTVAANGTTSPSPTITAGPYSIDGAAAVKFASAGTDAGMGTYDFTQGGSLTLSIPSTAYATTYRSDVTVSVVTGP